MVETDDGIEELSADAVLVSTGSRPRIPDWAEPDGERILTTRQAYPPPELPEHLVVIGSGRDRRGVRAHVLVVRLQGDA